jgi:hypothetical protein
MNLASLRIILTKIRWLIYEVASSGLDGALYIFRVPVPGIPVFIGELLPPRTARMAKWLSRSGIYSTVLVCSKRGYVAKFSDPHFEATFLFRNKWHLRRILLRIPDVALLHSFAPKSYFPDIARLTLNVPFIHDMQDVYAIYYGLRPTLRWLKKELPHEKACLEHADGLVAHSLEPNVAYRKYRTQRKPSNLFFPLYCDNDYFCEPGPCFKDGEIHIVYAGGVAGSHRNPKQYGSIMFQPLIRTLSGQHIHFHIYPSPSNVRADYEEYEATAKENPYFHFHEPVAQHKLAGEMSKYDWGILPFFSGQNEQSEDKYKYATTLKLFNFLEAGLPVIVSKDIIYQSWILDRYGCGVLIDGTDIQSLRNKVTPDKRIELLKNLLQARQTLSLEQNTGRLLAFYDKMLAGKPFPHNP